MVSDLAAYMETVRTAEFRTWKRGWGNFLWTDSNM
jgi:hypothetical protein